MAEAEELIGFDMDEPRNSNITDAEAMKPLTLQEKYHAILMKSPRAGCGKFQIVASTIVMLCLIGFGYIEYGLGYLELMPKF